MEPRIEAMSDPIAYALEQSAEASLPTREPRAISVGSFPGYSIVREIHRGGQGVVYEAWRRYPQRRVAIKALRDGFLAGPLDRERFRREIQFLSKLKHPNVVEVLDAGETGTHPFFVMEYVDGQALDDYMADHRDRLSLEKILTLFTAICDALSAAHLRGIVHRDLKPRNIIVDADARPRVLDFGLSRVNGQVSTLSQPSLTLTGQFVGSLLWASPEQAEGDSDKIDVRTDVYALGLILFQMLTGRFPYDVTGSMRRVLDAIRNEEPQNPSAFRHDIEDDLDRIVLRCLSKEPQRRYQSVGDLSRDIARYMRHEPIEAKRDSTWYVLRKVVRRHRVAAFGIAAALVFSMIYAGSVTYLYRKARDAEAQALLAAIQAREFFTSAHSTATFAVQQIAEKLKDLPGASKVRRELLEASYAEFERLFAHQTDNPELLADLAVAKIKLSDLALSVGDNARARRLRTEALVVREAQAAAAPHDWKKQADLSINLVLIGDLDKVVPDWDSTRRYYERARQIDEALFAEHTEIRTLLDNLAWSYERLGYLARLRGDLELAKSYFERQLNAGRALLDRDQRDASAQFLVATAYTQLASLADDLRDFGTRLEWLRTAKSIVAELLSSDPGNARHRWMAAIVSCGIGNSLDPNRPDEQHEMSRSLDECMDWIKPLLDAEPDHMDYRSLYAGGLSNKAQLAANRQEWSQSRAWHQQALEIRERMVADEPDNVEHLAALIQGHADLAAIAAVLVDPLNREFHFQRMRELFPQFEVRGMDDPRVFGTYQMVCADQALPAGLCDRQRALESARRGVDAAGRRSPARYWDLAVALIGVEEFAEAVRAAEQGLSIMPEGDSPMRGALETIRDEARTRLRNTSATGPIAP